MVSYASENLTETSPVQSFTEPLTLAEVKAYLKIPERSPAETAEDDELTQFIIAARETAEYYQGRDLVQKQYDRFYDGWPCEQIELRTPLVSVDLVRYRDSDGAYTSLAVDTDYIADLARGLLLPPYNVSWPSFTAWPSSAVMIRYTAGIAATAAFWDDAGARLKVGMKYLVSSWYNRRIPYPEEDDVAKHLLSIGAVRRVR